jgi:group I intron endonuclease
MSNILQTAIDLTDLFSDESQEGIIDGKIYKITNLITGKVYIGQTKHTIAWRWKAHRAEANCEDPKLYLHRSMKKYGIENFKIEQVDSANTRAELNRKENEWIVKEDCMVPKGFNLRAGGRCSGISEGTRQKLRDANLGKTIPEEVRKKIGEAQRGKIVSEETRKRMSESGKGKIVSEETRKKQSVGMRARRKGRCWFYNSETKEKKMLYPDRDIPEGFIKTRGEWYHNPKTGVKAVFCSKDDIPADFIKGQGRWYRKPLTTEKLFISCENDVPEGYVLGKLHTKEERTSIGRRLWLYNPTTGVRMRLIEGEQIPDGFVVGRIDINTTKGKKMYYHSETKVIQYLSEGDEIPEGFVIGKPFKYEVYNNPNTGGMTRIPVGGDVPEGFVKGGLPTTKGRRAYHQIETNNVQYFSDDDEIPDGFVIGVGDKPKREFYNNPITRKIIVVLVGNDIPDGFIKGTGLATRKGKRLYMNNETGQRKMFAIGEFIPEGFELVNTSDTETKD